MRLLYDWSSNGFFDAAHEGVKCARPGRTARAGSDRGRTPRAEFRFRSFFSILSISVCNRPLARFLAPRLRINSRYRSIFDLSSAEVTFISPLCARISIQATANSNKWGGETGRYQADRRTLLQRGRRGHGSSRRTRRAMRCVGSVRRSGAKPDLSPVICSSFLLRSPNAKQEDGEHGNTQNGSGDLGECSRNRRVACPVRLTPALANRACLSSPCHGPGRLIQL